MRTKQRNRKMIGRLALMSLLSLSICLQGSFQAVGAAEEATKKAAAKPAAETNAKPSANAAAAAEKKTEKLEELSLNDMNDIAILLRFISEQSINIYEEAARIPVGTDASPNYKPYESIPVELKTKKFLPCRQEWLVFYLGIMEPVIRDLAKEVSGIEAGSKQLVIPKSMEEVMTPAWEGWAHNTKEMNRHLDELVPMFDGTPPDNAAIQNKAVEIYNDVNALEKIRKEIFVQLKSMIKAGKDKIMVSPED